MVKLPSYPKDKKGVSTFIAVLILLVIVLVAALLFWAWTMGYIGGAMVQAQKNAMEISNVAQNEGQLLLYVKNIGEGDLKLGLTSGARIYVDDFNVQNWVLGGDASTGILAPGATGTIEIIVQPLWINRVINLRVTADDGTYAVSSYRVLPPKDLTITATASEGGSITPIGSVTVPWGTDKQFTWTPDETYVVKSVTIDGLPLPSPLPADWTFYAVTSSHTIDVQYELIPVVKSYTITATAGIGGAITPSGAVSVVAGSSQTFNILPDANNKILNVFVDGVAQSSPANSYTFTNVAADHTISVSFVGTSVTTYTITATAGAGGSISPSGAIAVAAGSNQAFTILPGANNKILNVLVDGSAQNGPPSTFTFNGVNANHSIDASFIASTTQTYLISATAGSGGVITPIGQIYVSSGSNQVFTIAANANYRILNVIVDGVAQAGVPASYTFSNVQANHAIDASFAALSTTTYTINAVAGVGGTITPSGAVIVNVGATQAFTIMPNSGYHVSAVTVDGSSVGAVTSYSFPAVSRNHDISATFSPNQYSITVNQGSGGTISPSGTITVNEGGSQTFTITPNQTNKILNVIVDGAVIAGTPTSYTFNNVQANHVITASYVPLGTMIYTITATAGAGGVITPSGPVAVAQGTSQGFTITPSSGYHITGVTIDGVSAGAITSYTFTNVVANHAIVASFALNTYTIIASAETGGSITPNGAVVLNYGASQSFTITPNASYKILNVVVDGVAQSGPPTSYTFSSVAADHTISATFVSSSVSTYIITATAGSGGTITPSGQVYVAAAGSQTFNVQPDANNKRLNVIVDGAVIAGAPASYTFSNVQANHAITASFVSTSATTYTITATAGSGGLINPSGAVAVAAGASQTFTIAPSTNYKILNVMVDGVAQSGPPTSYTFSNVVGNHAIDASFIASSTTTYVITATAGSGGTITPSGSVYVSANSNQAFAIAAGANNKVLNVLVDGVAQSGPPTSYTFSSVQANHSIDASFIASATPTMVITATAGVGGTITPSGSVYVQVNANQAFAIAANANYNVFNVVVDGLNMGAVSTYTFSNVVAAHTISATFAASTTAMYPITSSAGAGGTIAPLGTLNVASGGSQTYTITPISGYVISSVTVDGTNRGALATYTFSGVTASHTIVAAFSASTGGNKLVYTTGVPQTCFAGTQSARITVQRQTSAGTPITSGSLTVTLVSGSSSGVFTNPDTANDITSITIASGQSTAYYTYTNPAAGPATVTASATNYVSASGVITITPAIVTTITPSHGIIPGGQVVASGTLLYVTSDAGGTVTYTLYSGVYPSGTPVSGATSTVSVTNGLVPNSKAYTSLAEGPYYFLTTYAGDAKNPAIPEYKPVSFVVWPAARTQILLPGTGSTGDADLGTVPTTSSSSHYTVIDDPVTTATNPVNGNDGDSSYAYGRYMRFWTDDTYMVTNPVQSGTVSYVVIHVVSKTTGVGSTQIALTTHNQEYDGSAFPGSDFGLTLNYQDYTTLWTVNPYTGTTWTWTEVNDLMVGVSLYQVIQQVRCTQVYVEIYTTP